MSCFFLHLPQASNDNFSNSFHGNWEPARRAFRSKKSGTLFVLGQLTYFSSRLCHQKTGGTDPDTAIIAGTSLSGSWVTISMQRRICTRTETEEDKHVYQQRVFRKVERKKKKDIKRIRRKRKKVKQRRRRGNSSPPLNRLPSRSLLFREDSLPWKSMRKLLINDTLSQCFATSDFVLLFLVNSLLILNQSRTPIVTHFRAGTAIMDKHPMHSWNNMEQQGVTATTIQQLCAEQCTHLS